MSDSRVQVGSYTILGDRAYQQDLCAYEWNGSMLLAIVCDGMGGMEGGELASKLGVSTALKMLHETPPAGIGQAADWMRSAFVQADKAIAGLRKADGTPMNSGSTGIMVIVDGGIMQWGCVGDSRIYFKRGENIKTVTRMHNYNLTLDEMLHAGKITEQERVQMSARGEALISFLGIGGIPIIDTGDLIDLQEGDIIVLASDGVYKSLDDQQVNAIVEESGENMKIASQRLCDEAYRLGVKKQDNTTAIAIRYGS